MSEPILTPIKVRFGECDYYQHVNNTVYMTYTDVGMSDYFRKLWPDLINAQYLIHIVHVAIDFKNPATFEDDLVVSTTVSKIGETSVTMMQSITNAKTGVLLADVKKVFVVLDAKTGKKCKVPKEFFESEKKA